MRAEAHAAAILAGNLQRLETVHIFDPAVRRDDGGPRPLFAADPGEAGILGLGISASGTADHNELAHDMSLDQPGLLEHGIGGAADQRAETLQIDAAPAVGDIGGAFVVGLAPASCEQTAA